MDVLFMNWDGTVVLVATGQLRAKRLAEFEFAGELALTGELRQRRDRTHLAFWLGGSNIRRGMMLRTRYDFNLPNNASFRDALSRRLRMGARCCPLGDAG